MRVTRGTEMEDLTIKAEDLSLNITDKYCLFLFPEMKTYRPMRELALASTLGSYIFHGQYFNKYIEENRNDSSIIKRFCDYIEYLLLDENHELNFLAEVAILEWCLDIGLYEIRPLIREKGLQALKQLSERFRIDEERWSF